MSGSLYCHYCHKVITDYYYFVEIGTGLYFHDSIKCLGKYIREEAEKDRKPVLELRTITDLEERSVLISRDIEG